MKSVALLSVLFSFLVHSTPASAEDPCQIDFAVGGICASYEWVKGYEPKKDEEARMTIKYWDKKTSKPSGPYVDPVNKPGVELYMDMGNGHAHPSRPTRYTRKEEGVYEFSRIYFTMLGDWQIKFQRRNLKNAVLEEVVQIYRVTQ